ncbi:hypothetical protein ACLSU7_18050 [Bdellovibrio sp. HCB185ZH]|uniref:hypothetical protein n=1 Tax=Bdellovibrio sp. HCB185ZH TaxID=3394235 RepID=UPI0039A51B51
MKVSKKILMTAVSIISLHTASIAFAQSGGGPSQEQREAFRACADSVGMEKPEPGKRPTAPTEEQRTALATCMKEKGFEAPTHFGRPGGGPRGERPPTEVGGVQ